MKTYEFNQLGYHSLPPMEKADYDLAEKAIEQYIKDTNGRYYLLLNNELHYYTIFTWGNPPCMSLPITMAKEVIDIAKELGTPKCIELNDNGAIEVWITNEKEETTNMYLFFIYDQGVIKV